MLYRGDGGKIFRERYRFVWWVKVLRGQGWKRRRIFLALPRVWDDRKLGSIAGFSAAWGSASKNVCASEGSGGSGMVRKRISAVGR